MTSTRALHLALILMACASALRGQQAKGPTADDCKGCHDAGPRVGSASQAYLQDSMPRR